MPIISKIGRKSPKMVLLIATIYVLLIVGGVTMVYPFLLMLAGSTKSSVDEPESRVIPRYLTDADALWAKHVEGLFNESLEAMRQVHDSSAPSFRKVARPGEVNEALALAWREFLESADLPPYTYTIGYLEAPVSRQAIPSAARAFKKAMIDRFDNDISRLNLELGTDFVNWNRFIVRRESYLLRREKFGISGLYGALQEFKADQPIASRYYFTIEGFFRQYLKTQYSRDIGEYNAAHGTRHESYRQVHLDRRVPSGAGRTAQERKDWEEFVRMLLNPRWLRADAAAGTAYRAFLKAKWGRIDALNATYGTKYKSFAEVPLMAEPPDDGKALTDWDAFVQGWTPLTGEMHILPIEMIRVHSVDFMFRDHLRDKYGTPAEASAALGVELADWMDVFPPQLDLHYLAFRRQKGALRREFTVRNYIAVTDYMILHGRGILNTSIYCTLAVLGALLVNPLAAYALSRYKPPSAYKILLFLMLTMAFPPLVAQIPVFLMLRDLNLLNTFWALILPGLANGYSIFLLKGFFDSLPKELYESAAIDGAGEFRIFWQITMSLSKPILAVIALGAFNYAYANFMFALLICQDQKMWTLMVWLYNLQQYSCQGVIFASLIISAIPIFIMFVLCQNIIMRGIVVPVEK